MANGTSLTRTCSICGQQKPLSAFLQISSERGTNYGHICSACRGTQANLSKKPAQQSDEGTSSTKLELRLGSEAKTAIEKQLILASEKQKADSLQQEKHEKELSESKEIKSGKELLDRRRRDFYLDNTKMQKVLTGNTTPNKSDGLEKISAEAAISQEAVTQTQEKLEKSQQLDSRITKTDFTSPVFSPEQFKIQHHNPLFRQFATLLGKSAPILRTIQQLYDGEPKSDVKQSDVNASVNKETLKATKSQHNTSSHFHAPTQKTEQTTVAPTTASEFAKKMWGKP